MKQYSFQIVLRGLGDSAEEAWQDATERFALDPKDFESYNESRHGTEVAIIDIHGNIIGEGFLTLPKYHSSDDEYTEVEESDIIEEVFDVLDSEIIET